ncbi:hypothetical protein ACFULT_07965 [Rhodococcus sp. NPDC057297]
MAQRELDIPSMFFEGAVVDASFYEDEVVESRLTAMLENIDICRSRV